MPSAMASIQVSRGVEIVGIGALSRNAIGDARSACLEMKKPRFGPGLLLESALIARSVFGRLRRIRARTIDELDVRHRRAIADAEAALQDARIAALALAIT